MSNNSTGQSIKISGWILYPAYIILLAMFLTLCDFVAHVSRGVLSYTPVKYSLFSGQSTGPVFIAFLVIAVFCALSGWLLFRDYPALSLGRAMLSVCAFAVIYFVSGIFPENQMALYIVFMLTWVMHLFTFAHETKKLVAFSVLLGVLGPVFEGQSAAKGEFHYNLQGLVYNVPVWLSVIYFHGALAVAATLSTLESRRK